MPTSTRIKEIREREGYSRKDFAKEYGIPYSTLTNYENGTRKPPYDLLLRMAEEFGTTVDYLLCYTDSPKQKGGSAGLFGEVEMQRGLDILLKNIGFMFSVDGKRYSIYKWHESDREARPERLEAATIKLVRRMMRFADEHRNDRLLEIAEDGVIDDDERPEFLAIAAEISEIVKAGLALMYTEEV